MDFRIEQQCHGYKNGHQVLAASTRLARADQDVLDRLSDNSGPLRPAEIFEPYVTGYPLPSGKFYVIARTWQDLKAPRAGCVLTRSLLVPMSSWETLDSPASLLDLLLPVDKQEISIQAIDFKSHPVELPQVVSKRTTALVEALFLESRRPIVMFDEAKSLAIAERLLTALWPSMRRVFSICTWALSPRSVGGKSFDLMFAPLTARSRFAQWEGRIIEPASEQAEASRHRWTALTAKHIFEDDPPSLVSLDTLGILSVDEQADESSLRLALLWNELLEKSESSPMAILGLMDILNSRGKSSAEQLASFVPLISRGVDLAKQSMSSSDALRFLLTLSGKFPARRPPLDVLNKIREAFSWVAIKEPGAVISLLLDTSLGNQTHAPIVTAGIGDGFARISDSNEVLKLTSALPPEDELRLLAYSRPWAVTVMRATEETPSDRWSAVLANALCYPDDDLRMKSRRNVVPLLSKPDHAVLLSAILQEIDNRSLFTIVDQIRESTRFEIADFDEPLRRATRGREGMLGLRRAILAAEFSPASDRFLLATIQPSANDVEWLLGEQCLDSLRTLALLASTLARASERDLQSLVENESLSERIVTVLLGGLPQTSSQLARVLISGNLPIQQLLQSGCRVLPFVEKKQKAELILRTLTQGLAAASSSENLALRELLGQSLGILDAHRLIALAIPRNAPRERVTDNVVLLNDAAAQIRAGVLMEIEELSDRLISRRHEVITGELVAAWTKLLADSGQVNQRAQMTAAAKILSFALEERDKPVSPLIVVAFPIVYAELRAGHETPSLLSFFFIDWDRCKTARGDVVRAFLNSVWPPSDLIRAVEPTGDLDRIFKRLLRERNGESFLAALREDVGRFPARERKRLEASIAIGLSAQGINQEKAGNSE